MIARWAAAPLTALIVVAAPALAQFGGDQSRLAAFADQIGLRDVAGFVETVGSLRASGRLPPRYVTKEEARAHGWHGGGLCEAWPGRAIGGDEFHNFGGALPGGRSRRYREADLDETCYSRGAKRLIYDEDGAIYVTTDHYRHFTPAP